MSTKNRRLIYIIVTICLSITLAMAICYAKIAGEAPKPEKAQLLMKWTHVNADGTEKEVELPYKLKQKPGNKEIMYTVLPEEFDDYKVLTFWTEYQDVEVYLEEEVVYDTAGSVWFDKVLVPKWNDIELPSSSGGKILRIEFSSDLKAYEYWFGEVLYGSYDTINQTIMDTYSFNRIIDLIIMVVGISFIVFGFVTRAEHRYKACQIFFGLTAVLVGVWLRTNMKGFGQGWTDDYIHGLIGYFSLCLIPIVLTIFVKLRVMRIPVLERISDLLIIWFSLSMPVVFVMQAAGFIDPRENLIIGHVNLCAAVIWSNIIIAYYYTKKRERIPVLSMVNGLLLTLAFSLLYIWETSAFGMYLRTDQLARLCIVGILVLELVELLGFLKKENEYKEGVIKQNKNLKIQMLTNQIRPHFILNTLGAIRSIIHYDPEYADELLYDFSKYIRKNIEQRDYSKVVPFFEELDYIDTYLRLEKLRFGDRIIIVRDLRYTDFMILPLTIQPLVENAVKHGLMEKREGGTVYIRTFKDEDKIVIQIEDDGIGFDATNVWEKLERSKSVGMKSALYRLIYEMDGKVQVESAETGRRGSIFNIEIPMKWGTEDEDYYSR